jgi:hypothetical protein
MATTKKSTTKQSASRRTKTAAAKTARATKTTAKRAAAKTTKKPATTQAAKSASAKVVAKTSNLITRLHIINIVVSAVLAAVAAFVMSGQTYELVKGLLVKNELPAPGAAPFVPAVHHVYDLELRWAVVGIMVLSALMSLLFLTVYKNRYTNALRVKVNGLRWIDIAVLSALITEVVALLSGINDILVLKLVGLLVVITCALNWVAEKRNVQANRPVKSEMIISVVTGVLPWLLIGGYALCTWIYGDITSPWYVYALYAVVLAGFIGYCVELKKWVKGKTADYAVADRNYLGLSILIRAAFAIILIVGIR